MDERKIIIGLITSTEYLKKVRTTFDVQFLQSTAAKRLATWCVEYYDKYAKAPMRDIEGIFYEKIKATNFPKEVAEEIEQDILPSLSEEYENEGVNTDYLIDQTIGYFRLRQATLLHENQQIALRNNDLNSFFQLQTLFKPISINDNEQTLKPSEIYTMEAQPVQWLIEDLLPKGLTIFGGKGKTGKSYLMLNMAINLALNNYMFDDESSTAFRGKQGYILYLSLEDPVQRLRERMIQINTEPNQKMLDRYLDIRLKFDKLHMGGLAAIENWLKSKKRPILVVIDTLAMVWNKRSTTPGSGLYAEEYEIYAPLRGLSHKYDTSIIVLTHTKKTREQDVFDEILGGGAIQGVSDNLMVLSPKPGIADQRILAIRGKDIEEIHLSFKVSCKGSNWYCMGEDEEVQVSEQRQEIIELLQSEGRAMQYREIVKALNEMGSTISPKSVSTLLIKMFKDHTLVKPTYGVYALAGHEHDRSNYNIAKRIKR